MAFTPEELKNADLTAILGGGGEPAPISAAPPAESKSYLTHEQLKNADDLGSVIGVKPYVEPAKVIPESEKEREAKINAHSEKAAKQVKEEGETGAFMHGFGNVPLLGPAYQAGKRYVQAYQGEGQGNTVGERVEDLRNQREAYEREVNKQHPYAKIGGELAQVGPMMFIPGVGWAGAAARTGASTAINTARAAEIAKTAGTLESLTAAGASAADIAKAAKAAEAAQEIGTLAKVAPAAAEVAGMGAEGGAWGAASAAGNKYFGTAQPSDQADIGEATKEGALFGSAIGAGGKAVGAAYSKFAPEWWRNARLTPNFIREALGKDDPILTTFMEKQKIGDPEGLWFKKMQEAKAAGADVNPLDYRTKETDAWLQEQFQNHPDALIKLKQELNDRLAGASERGRSFFKKMAGIPEEGEFNIDKVRTEAQTYADKINRENFGEAYHPNNAAGTWSDNWNQFLADPSAQSALRSFDNKFSALKGEGHKSPFGSRAEMDISNANLDADVIAHLRENGVETLGDLSKLKPADVNSIYGYDPSVPSDTGKAFNTKKIYDELKSGLNGMDLRETVILNPESINAEYLDNLQLYLRNVAKNAGKDNAIPLQRSAAEKINNWADDIVNVLRNENDIYAKAHDTRAQFHRENNALDAGTSFMKNLGDTRKTSQAANEAKNMTPEEKEFFKYGVIDWIHNQGITGGGPTRGAAIDAQLAYKKIQTWLTKPDVEKTLSEVLGKSEFQSLGTFLKGEVLANDSAKRAQDLGAKGNLLSHFLRNAYIPGAGGIDWLLGHPALSVPAVAYRIIDFYAGERYARAIANKFTHPNPAEFQSAYDEIFKKPEIRDGINRYMAGLAYGISVQGGETKYNQKRVNDVTSKMSDDARKFTEDGIKAGMKIAHEGINGINRPEQRNMGGRVEYGEGGRTGYDWRQHYAPKDDNVGPVAPARASGYYPKEWRDENRQKGFAARARAMRNRAESEETPVDERFESRTKRDDGGRTLTQPIDPRQLEMERLGAERQQRMMASPLTNDVYHGSRNANISEFRKSTKGYLPLVLGTHTAKDPEISNTFTGNRDLPGGAMYPLKTYPDNRFYPVEQPIKNGEIRHDDFSVVTDVLHELIKHTPGIGAHLIEKNRGVNPKEAKKIINQLLANQYYSEEQKKKLTYPHNDLKSFLELYAIDAPYGQEEDYAKSYARLMRSRGYKGLKYQNTSKREVQNAKDPTSYIVFHPESDDTDWHPLRSKFANFDPNKRTSRDIGDKRGGFVPAEAHGGFIRRNRATGGRIPEADKLFKQAKKYVDDRTKGMLDQPDERIVHALRIAKARNS